MPHSARTLGGAGTSADSHLHAVTGDRHATICLAHSIRNASLQEGFHLPARELPARQPHLCYVQGAAAHHMQPHQGPPWQTRNSLTATTRLPCILLLRNTVVDHGARPSYHQGWWTPNRHGRIGLQQGFRQSAPRETAEQTATVWNTRTYFEVDRSFPWRPHTEGRSRWLSFHHGQRHLWRSTRDRPRPLALPTFYQQPAVCPWPWNQVSPVCRRLPGLRAIHTIEDQIQMQRDLDELQNWSETWGMHFNAKKCNVMTLVRGVNPLSYFYQLNNTILDRVNACDYLGITISENLSWTDHITANAKKANAWLGFLRKRTAYVSLVRSFMEYSSTIWNPYLKKDKDALEKVQRRAARWIRSDYRQRSSVTAMLTDLRLANLEKRREDQKLLLMYKFVHRLVGVSCEELGLEKADKRTRASHCHKLRHHQPTTTEYRHSFICSTIPEWNKLPASMAEADSVAIFKSQLARLAD